MAIVWRQAALLMIESAVLLSVRSSISLKSFSFNGMGLLIAPSPLTSALQQAGITAGCRPNTVMEALPPIALTTVDRVSFPARTINEALRSINRTVTWTGIIAMVIRVGTEHSSLPSKRLMAKLVNEPEPMIESIEKTEYSDAETRFKLSVPITILDSGATVICDPIDADMPIYASVNTWRALTIMALPERSITCEQGRSTGFLAHDAMINIESITVRAMQFAVRLNIKCLLHRVLAPEKREPMTR
jgi:hypothetical protein